jgi:phosphocarrier protein
MSDAPELLDVASARVTLRNKRGLHARAAAKFASAAQEFEAKIDVTSHNEVCCETVVGHSIMELLLLGSACGEDISITARGPDAQIAVDRLVDIVENRFGEDE